MARPMEWWDSDSQDNALATATKAAVQDRRNVLTYVMASYSVPGTSGLLQIKQGSTVVTEHYIHGADVLVLEIQGAVNEAVSAELAASGTGGQIGKVTIIGHTE